MGGVRLRAPGIWKNQEIQHQWFLELKRYLLQKYEYRARIGVSNQYPNIGGQKQGRNCMQANPTDHITYSLSYEMVRLKKQLIFIKK